MEIRNLYHNDEVNLEENLPLNEYAMASGSYFSRSDEDFPLNSSDEFSFFKTDINETSNFPINNIWELELNNFTKKNDYQIKGFYSLISKRKDYLDTLEHLENWISGESEAPNREVIDTSKSILDVFRNWISANTKIPIPKIVMGPIPTGGITVELRPNKTNAMFICIQNNSEIEIDIMLNNRFISLDKKLHEVTPYLLEAYEQIVNE